MANILIVGVGGQGTLLASRVLGEYAIKHGYDCKVSEVHGMAQRGGSVVTYVKFGKEVHSPIIDKYENANDNNINILDTINNIIVNLLSGIFCFFSTNTSSPQYGQLYPLNSFKQLGHFILFTLLI